MLCFLKKRLEQLPLSVTHVTCAKPLTLRYCSLHCLIFSVVMKHYIVMYYSTSYLLLLLLFTCVYCDYVQTPADGPTGGLCPTGSYCPLASSSPLPCPPGTFSNSAGLSRPEECVSCPPG